MNRVGLARKRQRHLRRKRHIRKRIVGTAVRPRLTIYKSNRFTYIQAIDDDAEQTVVSASNREKALSSIGNTVEELGKLGEAAAKRLQEQKIAAVVFDRNGYPYHGKLAAVAEGVRKGGISL